MKEIINMKAQTNEIKKISIQNTKITKVCSLFLKN